MSPPGPGPSPGWTPATGRFLSLRLSFSGRLNACRLTVNCCEKLSTAISTSRLRELDLSNNPLADAGVRALWGGLKGVKLDTLRWAPLSAAGAVFPAESAFLLLPFQIAELQPDARHVPAHGSDHQLRLVHAESAGPL